MKYSGTIAAAVVAFMLLLLGGIWWVSQASAEILRALGVVLQASTISAIVACIAGSLYLAWHLAHRAICDRAAARVLVAQARRAERSAQYSVVTAGQYDQVFISEENPDVLWRSAHFDPRVYANGKWVEPSRTEIAAYLARLEAMRRLDARTTEALLPASMQPPYLLGELGDVERALIVGSSGSGKTNLLQHMIAGRRGDVLVIDPHDDTHTWPDNAQVIGAGEDYEAIEAVLFELMRQVRARYQERATGQPCDFAPLSVFVDEWRSITMNTRNAAGNIKAVLTGGRKVSTCCVVASHSERAAPLGLAGEYDLKDGFVVVRLAGDKARGFSATLDKGQGEQAVILPGPYTRGLASPTERPQIMRPDALQVPMDPTEAAIVNAWDQGTRSITKLGILAYGSKGGQQNDLVREILRRHGRV